MNEQSQGDRQTHRELTKDSVGISQTVGLYQTKAKAHCAAMMKAKLAGLTASQIESRRRLCLTVYH